MQLSSKQRQRVFLESEVAVEIRSQLLAMENDPLFITESTYMPVTKTSVSFSDKHVDYMSIHQDIQPRDYMNNLRLRTRLR